MSQTVAPPSTTYLCLTTHLNNADMCTTNLIAFHDAVKISIVNKIFFKTQHTLQTDTVTYTWTYREVKRRLQHCDWSASGERGATGETPLHITTTRLTQVETKCFPPCVYKGFFGPRAFTFLQLNPASWINMSPYSRPTFVCPACVCLAVSCRGTEHENCGTQDVL